MREGESKSNAHGIIGASEAVLRECYRSLTFFSFIIEISESFSTISLPAILLSASSVNLSSSDSLSTPELERECKVHCETNQKRSRQEDLCARDQPVYAAAPGLSELYSETCLGVGVGEVIIM